MELRSKDKSHILQIFVANVTTKISCLLIVHTLLKGN